MKRQLRQQVLETLQLMTQEDYQRRSSRLHERLLLTISFTTTHMVGCTISRFPEPDTRALIEYFWKHDIPVAAPVSNPNTKEMTFYQIHSWEDVTEGYKGIQEPVADSNRVVTKEQFTHILVPGVIVDQNGYRIGFGGGFYDRFLMDCQVPTILLAFNEQVLFHDQIETHDIPVQLIVTETELIRP
ncbi:5-formyltetrahydrofolate cyclo-ligase [Chryseomicrobium palamuruense]|uniref:5-formyltetrahydrofolate cyclo-ligase n=1 Tax=Chryseomicrobium palamuruense TaxID=682973 RepID=A0ABV8UZF0_9BACL